MQASSMDTPTAGYCGTIFVAIELSQRSWLVTMHCPDRDKISHHRLEGGDHAGLLALVDRMGERATRALGVTPAVVSCYEAGYDGFWLHRLLMAAGITNHVFDPASIAVDQPARLAKLAGDAEGLARPGGAAADHGRDQARTRAADAGARAARGARAATGGRGPDPSGGSDGPAQRTLASWRSGAISQPALCPRERCSRR